MKSLESQITKVSEFDSESKIAFSMHDTVIETERGTVIIDANSRLLARNLVRRLGEHVENATQPIAVYWGARKFAEVVAERQQKSSAKLFIDVRLAESLYGSKIASVIGSPDAVWIYINIPRLVEINKLEVNMSDTLLKQVINIWLHESQHVVQIFDPNSLAIMQQNELEEKIATWGAAFGVPLIMQLFYLLSSGQIEKNQIEEFKIFLEEAKVNRREILKAIVYAFSALSLGTLSSMLANYFHYQYFNESEIEAREALYDVQNLMEILFAFKIKYLPN